jgi:hypothetical protein
MTLFTCGFENLIGLGGGAELAEGLGEVLQVLAADIGGGVLHGFEHLGFGVIEAFLVQVKCGEFHSDEGGFGGAVEDALQAKLGGDVVAF